MTAAGYLRYPHIQGDLLTFVADDDVWLAPADGGRAWRLSAEGASVSYPRLSPDARTVAWTTTRDDASEIYVAGVDGSGYRRLTYWGDGRTRVTGWSDDGEILAISATGQPARFLTWAHAVPVTGGTPRRLEFGPAGDITAHGPVTRAADQHAARAGALEALPGGTSGRLWVRDGEAGEFTRILAACPARSRARCWPAAGSCSCPTTRAPATCTPATWTVPAYAWHTDHDGFYARNPSTDGARIVYHVAGEAWVLDDLSASPGGSR